MSLKGNSEDKKTQARIDAIATRNNFITNKLEKDYLSSKIDSGGRYNLEWLDLYDLKINPDLFRKYLLSFSKLENRCLAITRQELIGFTQTDLYELYGIHKDLMGRFTGVREQKEQTLKTKKHKPKLRDMLAGEFGINRRLIAFIAIIARVPYHWFEAGNGKPQLIWETDHFEYLNDIKVDEEELIKVISSISESKITYDVRPLILLSIYGNIYIRLEVRNGDFMFEIFNRGNPLKLLQELRQILIPVIKESGVIQTVIPQQINYVLMSEGWESEKYSPEVKPLDL